jgi:transposase
LGLSEEEEEKSSEKAKHPKRGNNQFRPIASHLHFHESLEPGDICPACGQGKVYPFREKVIPILIGRSPLAYEVHRLQTLRCNACGQIFEPKFPAEIPKAGHATASAQAALILLHYKIGVPFASIATLQQMYCQNVSLAQQWDAIERAAEVIRPIYNELKRRAANAKLFYTDDTGAKILSYFSANKENRKKKKRKKNPKDRVGTYSSVIIGCMPNGHEIYLFYHGRQYAGENFADLLKLRDNSLSSPIQMKDASTMNIPSSTKVVESKCNAHAIRKFKDLMDLYPRQCEHVLKIYGKVNKIVQILIKRKVSEGERLAYHQKYCLPLMEQIKKYVTNLIDNKIVEPNSSLGEAINYFLTHYKELTAFCYVEGATFDNNKAERALKMIIRLRKTSMFYKTEKGAEIGGILQSVLFTAQEAGINPLNYLQFILENPEKVRANPEAFLPWMFSTEKEGVRQQELREAPAQASIPALASALTGS